MSLPAFSVSLPLPSCITSNPLRSSSRGPFRRCPHAHTLQACQPPSRKPSKHDLLTGRDPARVKILDTTLRDGALSSTGPLSSTDQQIVARQLWRLGVDILEVGTPASSEQAFQTTQAISSDVGIYEQPPIICAFTTSHPAHIDLAAAAIASAICPRLHLFARATASDQTAELHTVSTAVQHACALVEDVQFAVADAPRADPTFVSRLVTTAVAAGARTVTLADSTGRAVPSELGELSRLVVDVVDDDVTVGVHAHDDLGLAVANSLEAVTYGVRQIEVSVNGLGARVGNASLVDVLTALHVRRRFFNSCLKRPALDDEIAHVDFREIVPTVRLVGRLTSAVGRGMRTPAEMRAVEQQELFMGQDDVYREVVEMLDG